MTFDCQSCGACCIGLDVLLDEQEAAAFAADPRLARLVVVRRLSSGYELPLLRRHPRTDRCLSLAGPLHECRCTIYAQRPELCRALEPGSPHCLEARRREGMPAPPLPSE